MEVVLVEVNSLFLEEIMDIGIILVDDDSIEVVIVLFLIFMEIELEEIVNINFIGDFIVTFIFTELIIVYSNYIN